MKQRNQIYKLFEMLPGEKFYFQLDRKKTLYSLYDEKPFEEKIQAGYKKHYALCLPDLPEPGKLKIERHLTNRFVIFLRSINDKTQLYE